MLGQLGEGGKTNFPISCQGIKIWHVPAICMRNVVCFISCSYIIMAAVRNFLANVGGNCLTLPSVTSGQSRYSLVLPQYSTGEL